MHHVFVVEPFNFLLDLKNQIIGQIDKSVMHM